MKILIVDDTMADRMLLRYNCERHGYRDIIEARDGQEGLELAEEHRPALIISDALMPRMDGFNFLRALKSRDGLKAIPFVFYSATYTGYNEEELARSLGAEAFIAKPLEPEEFWSRLTGILNDIDKGTKRPGPALAAETEQEYLKEYSRVVAARLEEKVRELQEAKDKIAMSEAFIKSVFDNVDEGFVVVNRSYDIVSANEAYAKQVNLPVADLIGRPCYECSHQLKHPCFESGEDCTVRHTFETGEPWTAVHAHPREGGPMYLETKSFPLRDESGSVNLVIEVLVDITERKKLEDQLRQAQKMEAVGQLAGGVAHDFNNVLTAILGYGNMLQLKMKAGDPLRANVDQIVEAANRGAQLTHSLLAFSRKQAINPQPLNLNDIIVHIRTFLQRVIGEDIELRTMVSPEPLIISADSGQIEQVLMNLAANARDAMPQGGVFTIQTKQFAAGSDYVRAYGLGEPGTYAEVSMSDTGVGMDEETKKRIFEPFFTTKEAGKGTGLGLSIVYGIVRQHQGFVNVYSEPGHGTNFKIYFPVVCSPVEERKTQEITAPAGGTETILYAEDDAAVRELSRSVLAEFGYTVIPAVDGNDAVRKFRENKDRIQLVMLDMIMPGKSGSEVCEEISALCPGVAIMFMSGYTPDYVRSRRVPAEDVEVIEKPIAPMELLKKVRAVLDRRPASRRNAGAPQGAAQRP